MIISKVLKIISLLIFISIFTIALSLSEAPVLEFPKTVIFSNGSGNGAEVTGPGDMISYYTDIAGKGMVTGLIRDECDGRFLIIKVGVWDIPKPTKVSRPDKVNIEVSGVIAASVSLVPFLPDVADGREHAPEQNRLNLLPPDKQPTYPPRVKTPRF
jgi:hypothetical protein